MANSTYLEKPEIMFYQKNFWFLLAKRLDPINFIFMAIKLIKACKELNIGIATLTAWCERNGYCVEHDPNYRLSDELFAHLAKAFHKDKEVKLNADRALAEAREKAIPCDYDIFRTEASEEELEHYWEDDYGVRYSIDGTKVLKASKELKGLDYIVKKGVLTICDSAFQGKGLHSITLPDSVVSIGGVAFANNDDMEYCNIPASVKYIVENNPWGGCFCIKKMKCESPLFQIKDCILYSFDFRVCYGMIYWNSNNIEIDFKTKIICANAFWSCRSRANNIVESVRMISIDEVGKDAFDYCKSAVFKIERPIKHIESETFESCESLESIDLSQIKRIPTRAFVSCKKLKEVRFSSELSFIDKEAFKWCEALECVEIPKSVTFIAENAFDSCISLCEFKVDPKNTSYTSIDGVLYNKSITRLIKYPPAKHGKEFVIPDTVCEICDRALGQTFLESVICRSKILSFGRLVFYENKSLNKCYLYLDDRADAQSAWNLGSFLFTLESEDSSIKQNGYNLITKSAMQGLPEAQVCLARCFKNGWYRELDVDNYIYWLMRASKNKNYEAMCYLAVEYITGENISKDYEKAYDLLSTVENATLREKMHCQGKFYAPLGYFYMTGKVVEKDVNKAVEYFKNGVLWKDAFAEYFLAMCYENGDGIERDLQKAKEYYLFAKEHGHNKADEAIRRITQKLEPNIEEPAINVREKSQIMGLLKQHSIGRFYHFTSRRNIISIKKMGGLYSWYYMEQHDIDIPVPGGSDLSRKLDTDKRLADYVRLSFCPSHPMAYRLEQEGEDIVVLEISTDVAVLSETKFSNMNAADSLSYCAKGYAGLKEVDIDATQQQYLTNTDPLFKYMQAEVLVKTHIPAKYILNLDEFI